MKKIFLTLTLISAFLTIGNAQTNLVTNPSFSELIPGSAGIFYWDRLNTPNPWEQVIGWNIDNVDIRPNLATPDIFKSWENNMWATYNVKIHPCEQDINGNYFGKQRPYDRPEGDCPTPPTRTDAGYAGLGYIFSYDANNQLKANTNVISAQWSEYLTQRLPTLAPNKIYKLKFKIIKANKFVDDFGIYKDISLTNFGAILTNSLIPRQSEQDLRTEAIPDQYWNNIKVLNNIKIDRKGNYAYQDNNYWMEVSGYFNTCTGDEFQYLCIGHFNNDIRKEIGSDYECNTEKIYGCYYFIDEIELIDVTSNFCNTNNMPICNLSCNYEIITKPEQKLTTPCPTLCRTSIGIRKVDCNLDFDFVKIVISEGTTTKFSDIIQFTPEQKTAWNNNEIVIINYFEYSENQQNINYKVETEFFKRGEIDNNNNIICIDNPGKWFGYKTTNFISKCRCECQALIKPFIIFEKEPNTCCYIIKFRNNNPCPVIIDKNDRFIAKFFRKNSFGLFGLTEEEMKKFHIEANNPTFNFEKTSFINLINFYFLLQNHITLNQGQSLEVGKICFPQDGFIYYIDVTYGDCSDVESHILSDYCDIPQSDCCQGINVNYSIDNSQPDKCCYYLHITNNNTNPQCNPLNPFFFNVIDKKGDEKKNWEYVKIREKYEPNKSTYGPYCVNGKGDHNLLVDFIFSNGEYSYSNCRKTITQINCPIDDCCQSITVIPNTPTSGPNGDCCYTFNISSEKPHCSPTSLTIINTSVSPQQVLTTIADPIGASLPTSSICISSFAGLTNLLFDFTLDNNEHCLKNISVSCPENCCDKFSVTVNPIATEYVSQNLCCYQFGYTLNSTISCILSRIVVEGPNGKHFDKPVNNLLPISYNDEICIEKEYFGDRTSYPLKILFLTADGSILCPKTAEVIPCLGEIEPCSPPLQPSESGTWSADKSLFAEVECPPGSGNKCTYFFWYRTRTVEIPNLVVHRDIEITQYKPIGNNCNCSDAMVKEMLNRILAQEDVLINFKITYQGDNWPLGQERCFDNFRLITVDCWQTSPNGDEFRKCDGDACCYAIYHMCIMRTEDTWGNSIYTVTNQSKLSENSIQITNCEDIKCNPLHCAKWRPEGNSPAKRPIFYQSNDSTNCNLRILSYEFKSIKLDVECNLTGEIRFEFFDLLGNLVYNKRADKNSITQTYNIDNSLPSGTYFIRVIINGKEVLYNKINILK